MSKFNVWSWEHKHSVNCGKCGKMFDEREGFPTRNSGTFCQHCSQKLLNKVKGGN
jgi:DNA-directed RNA polymerase subunit RPC12/RpoP